MMRLICPNCGAQYEVADDVIPTAGRDVQCSNCGHTWFERPGASEAAEAGQALPPAVARPDPEPEPDMPSANLADLAPEPPAEPDPEPGQPPAPAFAPQPPVEPHPVVAPVAPVADPAPAFDPVAMAAAAGMPRRGLSADLAEMLREEAAREAEARAAEAPARPQEMPHGNALSDAQRGEEVRLRTARLRGEEPAAPAPAARRGLLPDIEKINSSLRPATEYGSVDTTVEPVVQARKRGARFGFSTVMLIVAILVGLYVGAPKLMTLVPAAAPVLTRYVAVVNDARLWIDLKMQAFIANQSAPAPTDAAPTDAAPAVTPDETVAPEAVAPETVVPETTDAPTNNAPAPDAPAVDTAPVAPVAPATDQNSG